MNPQDPNQVPVQPVQDPNMAQNGQMMGQQIQQPMQQPMMNQQMPNNGQQNFNGGQQQMPGAMPQQPYQQQGAQPDTLTCILCYAHLLALIPYNTKKDDPFYRFHALQGLNAAILDLAISIGGSLLANLTTVSLISWAANICSTLIWVCRIIGIINATKGKMEAMPIIGSVKIIK